MRMVTATLLGSAALIATPAIAPAIAKDVSYIGSVESIQGVDPGDAARGTVFLDENRNSKLDEGEAGVAGVLVSNGREVVTTADDGSYELPAYDDMNLFITKPAGHSAPMSEELVPQFYYIHKIEGSAALSRPGRCRKPSTSR
jgi:hypothetical protein